MSRRRNQTPRPGRGGGRDGRAGRGGQPNVGGNRAERRSFLERIRVREDVAADAPAGMRRGQQRGNSRARRRGEGWTFGRIFVLSVMAFLALALALSGLIAFLPPPGTAS